MIFKNTRAYKTIFSKKKFIVTNKEIEHVNLSKVGCIELIIYIN
jgi:hypothetical protein